MTEAITIEVDTEAEGQTFSQLAWDAQQGEPDIDRAAAIFRNMVASDPSLYQRSLSEFYETACKYHIYKARAMYNRMARPRSLADAEKDPIQFRPPNPQKTSLATMGAVGQSLSLAARLLSERMSNNKTLGECTGEEVLESSKKAGEQRFGWARTEYYHRIVGMASLGAIVKDKIGDNIVEYWKKMNEQFPTAAPTTKIEKGEENPKKSIKSKGKKKAA